MFVKLLHGLHSVLVGFIQKWTKQDIQNIEEEIVTEHDFEDGLGNVKAIPVDDIAPAVEMNKMTTVAILNDIVTPDTNLHNATVHTIPNDDINPVTEMHNVITTTVPNDNIHPVLEMDKVTVSTIPNDNILPDTSLDKILITTVENDFVYPKIYLKKFEVIVDWTDVNIPSEVQITHDFGYGEVPAAPVDRTGVSDTLSIFVLKTTGVRDTDNVGVSDTLLDFEVITND